MREFEVIKCTRSQIVYKEMDPLNYAYIVFSGKFEMHKSLAHEDKRKQAYLHVQLGKEKPIVENVLT